MRRLGVHAKCLCSPPNGNGVEPRTFEKNICGCKADLTVGAAHHSGQGQGSGTIGNHEHSRLQLSCLAVESHQLLLRASLTNDDSPALDARQVKRMQWMAK